MRKCNVTTIRSTRVALSLAAAVLMHCGSVMAADLSVCVDKASPTVDIDIRFATAVAKAQKVPLALYQYSGTPKGDDDDFELRRYKELLDEHCDLVVGFPYDAKRADFPAFLKATRPYAQTGFVLVTRQSDAPATLAAMPANSHVAVAYNTLPNYFFGAHPNLVRDIEEDESAAIAAIAAGTAKAAMVWRGSAVRYLEGRQQLDQYRLTSLDEPFARYDLVALYSSDKPAVAAAFETAIAAMRGNGELDRALGAYADTGKSVVDTGPRSASDAGIGMSVADARSRVAAAQRATRAATPSVACASKAATTAAAPAAGGKAAALYADTQATAGQQAYADHCALCHGKQLEGMAGPGLKSKFFLPEDPSHSLGDVFTIVSDNMPATEPGSLSKQQYVQIMAFLLKENGYPAGPTELTFDSAKASTVKLKYLGK